VEPTPKANRISLLIRRRDLGAENENNNDSSEERVAPNGDMCLPTHKTIQTSHNRLSCLRKNIEKRGYDNGPLRTHRCTISRTVVFDNDTDEFWSENRNANGPSTSE
jgi:hypothetical protein